MKINIFGVSKRCFGSNRSSDESALVDVFDACVAKAVLRPSGKKVVTVLLSRDYTFAKPFLQTICNTSVTILEVNIFSKLNHYYFGY